MLSQHDQRALAGIEQRLRETDPEFAHRLEHPPLRRARALRLLWWLPVVCGLVAGAALLATAIAARSADLAVAAAIVLVAGAAGAVLCAVAGLRPHP